MWVTLGLCCLEFIKLVGFVDSCIFSNLGTLWSLFLQIISMFFSFFSSLYGTPMMHILFHLIYHISPLGSVLFLHSFLFLHLTPNNFKWPIFSLLILSSSFFFNREHFLFSNFIYLFYLWLCWVFVSVRGLSPVVASGGHSSSRCVGLSPPWPVSLWSTGSRRAGPAIVAHGPSRSAARGILPDQDPNTWPLHWQADFQPLRHQGSPNSFFLIALDLELLLQIFWFSDCIFQHQHFCLISIYNLYVCWYSYFIHILLS